MSVFQTIAETILPNPEPFLESHYVIQIHVLAAFVMVGFTFAIILSPKGTKFHKISGKVWMGMMAIVACSSFFINDIRHLGPFSAIHILSVMALVGMHQAIEAVKRGDIKRHKSIMQSLVIGGVLFAGGLTLMPGRLMARMFFG